GASRSDAGHRLGRETGPLMPIRAGVIAIGLASMIGCQDPPLPLRFRVTHGESGACFNSDTAKVTTCSAVTMLCSAVVSIRIYNPDDARSPFIHVCKQLTGQPNLCSIAGVDLPQPAQPFAEQTLEVEMTVYPLSELPIDPLTNRPLVDANGELVCPTDVKFDASTGFPVSAVEPCVNDESMGCPVYPAVGGRAFYHPGDPETIVDLGCIDL